MLDASGQLITASVSTSQNIAILRLMESGIGSPDRQTIASGTMPELRSAATEC